MEMGKVDCFAVISRRVLLGRFALKALLALFLAGLWEVQAQTNEAAKPWSSRLSQWAQDDYLFGNWGGARTSLAQKGVDFEFFYAASAPGNLDGGLQRGFIYQGALLMSLTIDTYKLAEFEGGTFHAGGLWLHGQKPFSERYVGDMNKVNLIDFANAARLWEIWYQQKFFSDKLALKLGQLSIDSDFMVSEYCGGLGNITLLNQTFFYPSLAFNVFDIPGFAARGHGLATTPLAAPGAVVKWSPSNAWKFQAGVYGGGPDQSDSGTRFNLSQREGALSYFELGYLLNQGASNPGLEGSYKLGAYYHTGDFVDVYDSYLLAAGLPGPLARDYEGNYGVYFLAEQQLYREKDKIDPAKQGLVGFVRALGAPPDRNLLELETDVGLIYRGLIPARDWDSLALAASYAAFSDDIIRAQRDINDMAPGSLPSGDHEIAIELSYKIQATAWWTIQPSLQHVIHPGGRVQREIPDATVFIVQSTLRF